MEAQSGGGRRVLHVVVGGDIGGAERLVVELATRQELTRATHEIAVVTPNRALVAHFVRAGLVVHDRGPARETPLAYLYRSLGPADTAWLAKLIEARAADVVHTHTFGSHVLGTRAAHRSGRPQLRTEHHVMHYSDPSSSPFTRWAATRTERFVAVSEYVLQVLRRTAPAVAARTTVVRNGVDTAYFAPRDAEARDFRIGILCRLTAWKRVHLAIEAAAIADVAIDVIGDGEERVRLEALARRRGARARFFGHVPDPRPHLAGCHAILSTSDNEPLGLSVLEALSMRRPVVAFAGGGIPEIVRDGMTGFLVGTASAEAFAAPIARLRDDRAMLARMSEAARGFVVDHCGIERMCAGYAAAYDATARTS